MHSQVCSSMHIHAMAICFASAMPCITCLLPKDSALPARVSKTLGTPLIDSSDQVGAAVGFSVGISVGDRVGDSVASVGGGVGTCIGLLDGFLDGQVVGSTVG